MRTLMYLMMLIILANPIYASDKDTDVKNAISDNISEEFLTCASYFSIVMRGLEKSGEKETAAKYQQAINGAIDYALIAAQEGRTSEMAQRVTLSRYELNLKDMTKEIDNNFSNISILTNKYAYRCKSVMEKPEAMMEDWANKIIERNYNQNNKSDSKANSKKTGNR